MTIDEAFSGNLLAIDVTTKPEYVVNSQIIGYLYQIYETVSKGYAIKSGKDLIRLELPETEKLVFIPTNYLSDNYTLKIDYTTVGITALVDGENTAAVPEIILDLPPIIAGIQGDILGLNIDVQGLQQSVADTSLDWNSITGKPETFAPSTHTHAIGDVTGLETSLTTLTNNLAAIDTDITNLSSRVDDLESATPVSAIAISTTGLLTLAQNASTQVTAKEILKIYKRESLIGANLIATMTSNTSPAPLVASTNGSAAGSAFNVFDKVLTDRGWLANSQTDRYVQIDMGSAITADTLSCLVRSASITALEYARKLTLVTSDDGVNWSSPKVAITNWLPTGDTFSDFVFTETTARYWRLFCEDRPSGYPAVNEIKLSLSTGYRYTDVSSQYLVSKLSNTIENDVFTITKTTSGSDNLIITYL